MKKRPHFPPRRDSRITSQYIPDTGDIIVGVARGITGGGEILYRIEPEKLAGAIEDRRELAVIVNNLGLLVLAQLSGFNLAESLDDLPRALAKWGHMEKEFDATLAEKRVAEALAIAQKTVHQMHGHDGGCEAPDRAKGEPCVCKCECTGTPNQTICAQWCDLCKESDEGRDSSGHGEAGPSAGAGSESTGGTDDFGGAGPGDGLAADELGA